MKRWMLIAFAAAAAPLSILAACSSDSGSGQPPALDAGGGTDTGVKPDSAPTTDAGGGGDSQVVTDGGFTLPMAPPAPDPSTLGAGNLLLTASGEILALTGYNFPAVNQGDPVFADGWEVRYDHYIATFDHVQLWTNPDMVPTDQSQHGPLVAHLDGPWAVDMHQNGPAYPYVDGKEAGERAVAFAAIMKQDDGTAFKTDGTRYAIGFSAVTATDKALNVNLGPEGLSYYKYMIDHQCVVLYHGQAQWKGDQGLCNGSTPVDAGTDGGGPQGHGAEAYWNTFPKTVNFYLCYTGKGAPAAGQVETSYINCDNQDNDPAQPFPNEPHQRGIAFKSNTYAVGEVTFHTDHPFWESIKHDTPAHFDQYAAQVVGQPGIPTVHFDDLKGVDYTGFKDAKGNILPWRICDPNYQPSNAGSRVGQMNFDPFGVPHCTNNDPTTGLCDYQDYSKYNQSTQGHWNGADGLCFVKRSYSSPK